MGSRHLVVELVLAFCPLLGACGEKFTSALAPDREPDAGSPFDAPGGVGGTGGDGGQAGTAGQAGSSGAPDSGPDETGVDASVDPPIPFDGLLLWLRADRGVALEDGVVATWTDQSGRLADATQAMPSLRPRLVNSGSARGPSVEFDGEDDFLRLPSGFADFSAGVSMFAVALQRPTDACVSVLHFANGLEVDDLSFGQYNGRVLYEVENESYSGDELPLDTPVLWAVVHQPDDSFEVRLNRRPAGSGDFMLPASVERTLNSVGGTEYVGCHTFPGQIAEILVYARAVSPSELLTIEDYLQQRVGL